jgi:ubiquinol-cytochrome c reductase cytochrome b subunit
MYKSILKQPLLVTIHNHLIDYPTPENLNYAWNFGSLSGICLLVQIVTGILVGMHYAAHIDLAFDSVQHLMRDVSFGWLLRYLHANGASFFFIVVYIHIIRALFFCSYVQPRELVWISGIVILLVMIITAFIGYVLPWGQMSFWGATVITSLATAIPFVGDFVVNWIWGGFSVNNPTLNRFLSLHYLLPFILAALSIIHITILHQYGSTNPLGISTVNSNISFYSYFVLKDLIGLVILAISLTFIIAFYPDVLGHTDNLIPANPYVTPAHIVPEWYYLWVYAILRSIPVKILGILAIALVFITLALLPFIYVSSIRNWLFRPINEYLNYFLVGIFVLLTWLGSQAIDESTIFVGQFTTFLFFLFLILSSSISTIIENKLVSYKLLK